MQRRINTGGLLQVAVVTVCVDPELTDRITGALHQQPWLLDISHLDSYSSATRRPAFGLQMRVADAGIVFVDYSSNADQAIDCTAYLLQAFGPKIVIVAVGEEEQPGLILEAMRAGCSEYLSRPITDDALATTLQRFRQRWNTDADAVEETGSVLAVLGAKGGVGATTLAVHLAFFLRSLHNKKVLLIDSHAELGHACLLLGLDGSKFTFEEVVRNVNRLDSDLLQGFVGKHPSGLAVLSSPDYVFSNDPLTESAVAKTLAFLRSEFDYIVIDCARSYTETTRAILDAASRIYLVATPEICAVRDLSRQVDRVLRGSEAMERVHVVLNRASSQSGLDREQIEKALRFPISFSVPNNYGALVKSGNTGQPLSPAAGTDIGAEIRRWTSSLVQLPQPAEAPVKKRSGLFGLLGGKPRKEQTKGAFA